METHSLMSQLIDFYPGINRFFKLEFYFQSNNVVHRIASQPILFSTVGFSFTRPWEIVLRNEKWFCILQATFNAIEIGDTGKIGKNAKTSSRTAERDASQNSCCKRVLAETKILNENAIGYLVYFE